MVQFRGVNIHIVSQVDAKRLPEHSTARALDARGTVVACYVPVYPGAQIWLEYSIDGPYPPDAAYFFKMLINGQVVSSWDCTAKHDYHGKATYILHTVTSYPLNEKVVLQKSLAFASVRDGHSPRSMNDCIEIRIHRIKHRRRIRDLPVNYLPPQNSTREGALRLVDSGPFDFVRPARRYQYQLVDPQDEPYATFRFYCRTQDYLDRHQILNTDASLSPTSIATSISNYFDATSSPTKEKQDVNTSIHRNLPATPTRSSSHKTSEVITLNRSPRSPRSPRSSKSPTRTYLPRVDSRLSIRDSIEDLPSAVPRSPQSPKTMTFPAKQRKSVNSPTQASNPLLPDALHIRKRSPPKLVLNTSSFPVLQPFPQSRTRKIPQDNDSSPPLPPPKMVQLRSSTGIKKATIRPPHKLNDFDLMLDGLPTTSQDDPSLDPRRRLRCESSQEHRNRRPLSPFTPGGLLRRLTSTPIFSPRSDPTAHPTEAADQRETSIEFDGGYRSRSQTYRLEVSAAADRGEDERIPASIGQRRGGRVSLWSSILDRRSSSRNVKRNVTA